MDISANGIAFIKNEELFRSKPYLDPVGIPTIGYGSTVYENGKAITLKDRAITEKRLQHCLCKNFQADMFPP